MYAAAHPPRRPSLPRGDSPGHPPCAARDHGRHGQRGVGQSPSRANGSHNRVVATVLVVDDEPIVRDVVVRYLQRDGFTTLEAGDGDTARRLIETSDPQLVVLDVMLPGMDGLELCRWIREPLRFAGDPADRARRGGRPDRRARARRRRLRDEAVLAARARNAGANGAAPLRRSCKSHSPLHLRRRRSRRCEPDRDEGR